jgi:hypothetical protein
MISKVFWRTITVTLQQLSKSMGCRCQNHPGVV